MERAGTQRSDLDRPIGYTIRLAGQLEGSWADWFGGLTIVAEADGTTLLTGALDQPALHGVLRRARDLGLPLISVYQVSLAERERP